MTSSVTPRVYVHHLPRSAAVGSVPSGLTSDVVRPRPQHSSVPTANPNCQPIRGVASNNRMQNVSAKTVDRLSRHEGHHRHGRTSADALAAASADALLAASSDALETLRGELEMWVANQRIEFELEWAGASGLRFTERAEVVEDAWPPALMRHAFARTAYHMWGRHRRDEAWRAKADLMRDPEARAQVIALDLRHQGLSPELALEQLQLARAFQVTRGAPRTRYAGECDAADLRRACTVQIPAVPLWRVTTSPACLPIQAGYERALRKALRALKSLIARPHVVFRGHAHWSPALKDVEFATEQRKRFQDLTLGGEVLQRFWQEHDLDEVARDAWQEHGRGRPISTP